MGKPQSIPRRAAEAPEGEMPRSAARGLATIVPSLSAAPEQTKSSESTIKGKSEGITVDTQRRIPEDIEAIAISEYLKVRSSARALIIQKRA